MDEEWLEYHQLVKELPVRIPKLWGDPDFAKTDLRENRFDVLAFLKHWFDVFGSYKFPKCKLKTLKNLPCRYKKDGGYKYRMLKCESDSSFTFLNHEKGKRGDNILLVFEDFSKKLFVLDPKIVLNNMLFKAPFIEESFSKEKIPETPRAETGIGAIVSKRRERAAVLI